jgi:4-diphosphocytidyl-2-C-methyl-D-erythritol kinase
MATINGERLDARAYAKINVGLEVLGRREDGYHELRTILQTIDLYDRLSFERASSGITLSVAGSGSPAGTENLVHRAARLLSEWTRCGEGATIHLEKRIPTGAGLGGGSADAAITLLALDRLWGLGVPTPELHLLASRLGMDVPFFLYGGAALAVGRGDEIFPFALGGDFSIVLIVPDFSIETAAAYSRLRLTNQEPSLKLQHFAWGTASVFTRLDELGNDLEEAAGEHSTTIGEFKRLLRERGAHGSMMSGSGSSVYGIFHDEASAHETARILTLRGARAFATRTVDAATYRAKRLMPRPFSTESSDDAEVHDAKEGGDDRDD